MGSIPVGVTFCRFFRFFSDFFSDLTKTGAPDSVGCARFLDLNIPEFCPSKNFSYCVFKEFRYFGFLKDKNGRARFGGMRALFRLQFRNSALRQAYAVLLFSALISDGCHCRFGVRLRSGFGPLLARRSLFRPSAKLPVIRRSTERSVVRLSAERSDVRRSAKRTAILLVVRFS